VQLLTSIKLRQFDGSFGRPSWKCAVKPCPVHFLKDSRGNCGARIYRCASPPRLKEGNFYPGTIRLSERPALDANEAARNRNRGMLISLPGECRAGPYKRGKRQSEGPEAAHRCAFVSESGQCMLQESRRKARQDARNCQCRKRKNRKRD